MRFIKSNKIEILIFIFTFLTMYFFALQDSYAFNSLYQFLFDAEFKETITQIANEISLNPVIYILLKPFISHIPFDQVIIWATIFFQLIIPFLAATACFDFYKKHLGINKLKYYRKKSMARSVFKEIVYHSFKIAIAIFSAYFVFYLITIFCCNPPTIELYNDVLPRTLFLDLFGNDFYYLEAKLYWLMEGGVRFFLVPFTYAFMSCTIALLVKSIKFSYIITVGYYVVLAAITGAITIFEIPFNLNLYLNPSIIMASGSYTLYTIPLIFFTVLPIIISALILRLKKETLYD